MILKQELEKGKVHVTFTMPALEGVEKLRLVGDFNGWSEDANPMERGADGAWSVTLTLEAGRKYQYRYRDDLGQWHNDWTADEYVPNEFGSENSVLSLETEVSSARKKAKLQPKKKRSPVSLKKGAKGKARSKKKP